MTLTEEFMARRKERLNIPQQPTNTTQPAPIEPAPTQTPVSNLDLFKQRRASQLANQQVQQPQQTVTERIQSGQTLTNPADIYQLAAEQGRISQEEANRQKAISNRPKIEQDMIRANDEVKKDIDNGLLKEVNSNKYFEYQNKMDEAKKKGDVARALTYQSTLNKMDDAYKPMTKDWYNVTKDPDTEFLQGQIQNRVNDVKWFENKLTESPTEENLEKYKKAYDDYKKAVTNYRDALLYQKYNNNPVLEELGILGNVGAEALANIIEGTGEDAKDFLENRLGNHSYNDIDADQLLKTNDERKALSNKQFVRMDDTSLNALRYQAEKPNAGKEIKNLYNQILNGTYNGTAEDIRKILTAEKTAQNTFKRKEELQQTLEQKKNEFDWMYEPSKEAKYVLNALDTPTRMIPILAANMVAPGLGDIAMYEMSGNAAQDKALAEGADYRQAGMNKMLKGGLEAASEHLVTSSIDKAVGRAGLVAPSEWAEHIANPLLRTGVDFGVNVVGEGVEEIPSAILDPVIDRITHNPDAPLATMEDVWGAFRDSLLPTAIMQGVGSAMLAVDNYANKVENRINNSNLTDLQKSELINQVENGRKEFIKQIEQRKTEIDAQAQQTNNNQIARDTEALNLQPAQNAQTASQNVLNNNNISITDKVTELNKQGYNIPKTTADILQTIQNQRGATINFDANIKGNGTYNEATRTITLNPNSKRAIEFTTVHELAHDLKAGNMEDYTSLQNTVLDYARKNPGFLNAIESLDKTYKDEIGKGNYNISDEATNDILAEAIGNQEFLNSLAQEKPNLFERIYNWFKNVLFDGNKSGLTLDQRRILNKMQQGFRNAYNNAFNGAQQNSGVQYSKGKLITGEDIVISDDVNGTRPTAQDARKSLEQMLGIKYDNVSDNTKIGIEDKDIGKFLHDGYNNPKNARLKKRISGNYGEVLEIAKIDPSKSQPNSKGTNRGKLGFDYYDVNLAYPIRDSKGEIQDYRYYSARLVVRKESNGKFAYDLDNFDEKNNAALDKNSLSITVGNPTSSVINNSIPSSSNSVNKNVRHSLSEAEADDRTLAATHNLTEEKLRGVLELGGFPVPSIAISDVNKLTPTQFGDITVLFDKDTIDPADRRNEVYDRDVWSPTFPQVDYEIDKNRIKEAAKNIGIREDLLDYYAQSSDTYDEVIRKILNREEVLDKYMQERNLSSDLETEADKARISRENGIENYLKSELNGIYGKKGIYNGKEYLTPSGNRRSFKQLHDEYNLNNIVKALTKGKTKGGQNSDFFGGYGRTAAQLAKQFKSIEDIRDNKNRLRNYEDLKDLESLKDRTFSDINELSRIYEANYPSLNSFFAYDNAQKAIEEFARKYSNKLTLDNFKKVLKDYNVEYGLKYEEKGNTYTINDELLNRIITDLEEMKNMPTDYFEAKPQRAVGFEEIASVLIPKDLAEDTKQQLRDRGINYVEYDPTIEGDREAKYKEAAQDVLFSKSNNTWQQFLDDIYGKWNTGTRTNFEALPSNEELQQAERDSVANEPIAKYSLSEEQQNEVNDYINNLNKDTTLDDNFKEQILNKFDNLNNYKQFENIKQEVEEYKDKAYKGISGLVDIANSTPELVKQRPMDYTQRKDKNTSNQRKFFDNAETSNIIADETKNYINPTTYEQKKNLDTLDEVRQSLDERGNDMVEEWKHKSKNFTAKDVALGAILIERYQQNGDWQSAARTVEKLADMGTEAGRAVQMYSIFQRLSPETMAIYQQKALNKAFEEMKQRKTGKWVEANQERYKLTPEETQFIYEQVEKASQAIDEETKQRELSKIENMINNKLPPEDGQAIRALRRIAMLFNPKTQVRNFMGNLIITPANDVADFIGAKIDKAIAKKTGVRTTNNPNLITKAKGFKKGIKDAITDYKTGTRTTASGSKYEFDIGAKPFNENTDSKVKNAINRKLNGVNDLLSAVMSGGDRPFYEAAYQNSLEGQMKANKVTEATPEMEEIARTEGMQRTWNDDNNYTKAVLSIRKAMNHINIKGFGLGDLIIPFAKTPANLTKAMVEYSPAGFIESVIDFNDMRKAISRGEMTPMQQKKFVSSTSKAIAGSMLYLIAGSLVKAGAITGSADDDKDVKNFEQNVLGIQPYSVKLGDKTYTYSWANPINAPLAIMADTYKMSKENASKWDILNNAFKVAGETLVDNSFLQGIKELFSKDSISEGIVEAIESFPESLIPTFFSQIASLGDTKQRQTFEYQNDLGTVSNKIKNKVPGARNTLAPQVNTFGEEIENQNNAFNAFISPANVREARITDEQKALYDVYQETKDKTIFPMQAPYYVSDNGEKRNLTSQDRVTYQKASGNYVSDVYKDLFKEDDAFNDNYHVQGEGKVEILKQIASDGNIKGKEAVGVTTQTTDNLNDKIDMLDEAGIPLADYYLMWYSQKSQKGKQAKKNAISETARNLNHDLTTKQKRVLYEIFNVN